MVESKPWDTALVRRWLESRVRSAKLDQADADRRGYAAADDYDKAAAEEWACRSLIAGGSDADPVAFGSRIKELLAKDDYRATGINDDVRFERHVRSSLRKIARMAKANEGFANTLRHQ